MANTEQSGFLNAFVESRGRDKETEESGPAVRSEGSQKVISYWRSQRIPCAMIVQNVLVILAPVRLRRSV